MRASLAVTICRAFVMDVGRVQWPGQRRAPVSAIPKVTAQYVESERCSATPYGEFPATGVHERDDDGGDEDEA
jgi:hypothetical protein